ncbi:MAG: hypothetical protein HKN36_02585 [Hellea sp.]|nr:hypothetical protein [Hellea sp.]
MIKRLIMIGAATLLAGCSTHVQTTSGADFLDRYQQSPAYSSLSTVDADIMNIAAIEPDIRFPARIGLARIENGQLATIPGDEASYWSDMAEREGHRYGDFVPVSPTVAAMVARRDGDRVFNVVDDIRRGAARQHLDYVLLYEVTNKDQRLSNGLGFTDATILGLFLIPSRKVEVDTVASAILLDVRNGYPYATTTTFADNRSTTTKSGARSKRTKLEDKGRLQSVEKLVDEIEVALQDLKDVAYENLVAEGY